MDELRITRVLSGDDRRARSHLLRAALGVMEPAYRAAVALRNALFDGRLRRSHSLGRVTISIGNLTTGGTGKTPMTVEVVERLRGMGATPAVLLRGYRQADGKSDEQMVLAESLGGEVPVVADPNRVAAASEALEQRADVDVFVLDDGFQHRQAHRDLDLVLVDATQPFGFEHVLPRGLLREPPAALRRADAIIVTRADLVSADRRVLLDNRIEQLTGRPPVGHALHQWVAFYDVHDEALPLEALAGKRVAAICAIANPEPFVQALRQRAGEVVWQKVLPDHHAYTREQIGRLMDEAAAHRAEAVVLTGKDWVKWKPWVEDARLPLPILHPKLKLRMMDGDDALDALLAHALDKRSEYNAGPNAP